MRSRDDLEERIAHLSPTKRALLELKSEQKSSNIPPEQVMSRRAKLDQAPLSFAQQRLWLLDQLEPDDTSYIISRAIRARGALDVGTLERSLKEITRRHEALRTTFTVVDGEQVQVIAPTMDVELPVKDLSGLPQTERQAQAMQLAKEDARRPFDLERGPLFRAKLLRLGEGEHLLLLAMHHIVSDGWSMGVFWRELGALYEAFSRGEPSPLAELPTQYADYALWQRQWLTGEVLEKQLGYWKEQLAELPALELPTDHPRPAVLTHRGARQDLMLPESLTEGLKDLARRESVTLFMVLLGAFQVLLSRYSGQEDVAVGTPIAGRNRAKTEELIGFFVNTLVMRTDLSGDPSFREMLSRVREVALGAYDHQDLPFERLVEELRPERDLSRTPLFQVFFNMQKAPVARIELPRLTMESLPSPDVAAKFDLTLYVRERDGEVRLGLVYNADLFDQTRMAKMLEQLGCLLAQIVENPQSTIGSYSLVTPQARALLPDPKAAVPEPPYEPVTNAFLSWSERKAGQPAVRQGEQTWSYGELAASANALARYLLAEGIEPGDVVALHGARSFGLIAGMMAVLLSRGAFLTVDPNLPVERQRLMLEEAGAKHLLFIGERRPEEDGWVQELPSLAITSVASDTGRVIEPQAITVPEAIDLPEPSPDDPAYVFFTSGTTGTPKGILGCHKGLSHFIDWQRQTFAVGPNDRVAQLTSLSFDVLLRDVFLPLSSGATLCLPEEDNDLSADQILRWLEREGVTLLHTVPALAQTWLAYLPAGISLRALRYVFFAGEPLSEALVRRWREAFPEAGEIVNLYGPTETTMAKFFFRVGSDAEISPGVQPVGWPLPQTQALILSKGGQVCGMGEPGEVVIRTPFRTLGYIGSERETGEQRFVRNPFRDEEGDLLYYTGDRGRYRTDGALEYLGRLDHQVKIRGVRVEPGEVQAVLGQHPAVRESVVVARDDVSGGAPTELKRLVAYIVPDHEHAPLVSELRGYLKERLPEYMVPSAFVTLNSLPLTPNGKVNRRALPAPDPSGFRAENAYAEPRTPIEEQLVEIWEEVLGLERVGIHDDFFELGGHSLLATRVITRLRNAYGVDLPLRRLFEAPTVGALAARVEAARRSGTASSIAMPRLDNTEELRF